MSKTRIDELTLKLQEASDKYYQEGFSVMSDKDFDLALKELARLETDFPEFAHADSPVKRVGSDLLPDFAKVVHEYPMISIDNAYTLDEVHAYMDAISLEVGPQSTFTAELKIDGLSLGLRYREGKLIRAVTRGDGTQGDDVTLNAFAISSIPLEIPYPGDLEVRGEVYIPHKAFKDRNTYLRAKGEKELQNPRNAASGALKTKDPKEVSRRGLRFRAFGLAAPVDGVTTQSETVSFLHLMGFQDVNGTVLVYRHTVESFLGKVSLTRAKMPFAIDGVVIKVNELGVREELGRTGKSVRWALAYKFEAEQALSRVLSVTIQTGRTGKITPVAELSPVLLDGSMIKRASLHNFDEIARLGLRVGDEVVIEKGGEVIPKVVSVRTEARTGSEVLVPEVTSCPCCGSPVSQIPGQVDLFCTGVSCPDKLLNSLTWFVSRDCMNIMNVGESVVKALVEEGHLKHPLDFYKLMPYHFQDMEGMGAKKVALILDGIEASKKASPSKLLTAIGVPQVGKGTAQKVMEAFGGWDRFWVASREELLSVPDIGEGTAESILLWRRANPGFLDMVKGCDLPLDQVTTRKSQRLAGEKVVVTGSLSCMDREEIHNLVKEHGGAVAGSVSRKTTILIVGEGAGSKLQKAEDLGIQIWTEAMFLEKMGV